MRTTGAEEQVRELFVKLLIKVNAFIKDGKSNGTLESDDPNLGLRWAVHEFAYDDSGVHVDFPVTAESNEEWLMAQNQVNEKFSNSPQALELKSVLDTCDPSRWYSFDASLRLCIDGMLQQNWSQADVEAIADEASKCAGKEQFACRATVELAGIILRPQSIELAKGIKIRQTTRKDIEDGFPQYPAQCDQFAQYPTAIMEVEMHAGTEKMVCDRIKQVVTILQLFRVGSIKCTGYRIHSVVLKPWFGMGGYHVNSRDKSRPIHEYLVKEPDVPCLEKFFSTIEGKTGSLFVQENESFRKIAHDRYVDCLNSESKTRRITDAVMGLEALFLNNDRKKSCNLSSRVAHFMETLDKAAQIQNMRGVQVQKMIRCAYKIRSEFVHGDVPVLKTQDSFEQYGSIDDFLKKISEILRLALVMAIMMDVDKTEFIQILGKPCSKYTEEETGMVARVAQSILCTNDDCKDED